MIDRKDYLREVQKFTTSQYWYSGLRITAGVMVPLTIFILTGWLSVAIPFLWGALFVSITDTPGPIHHRRNGMVAAIILNAIVVLLTAFTKEYQLFLIVQIVVFGFLLSMTGIYGRRAEAVGTLALVLMLLNLLSFDDDYNTLTGSLLIAAGGSWYMMFSLMLYRFQPYRPVEQGLGEHLTAIADYVRARAAFYKEGANPADCFNRVMKEQSTVRNIQNEAQELLFKTRRFVTDASPKSRSLMMIYLDSLDLFDQTLYSYQDYELLHKTLDHTGLPNKFYGLILELAAGLEYIGISVQMGSPVKKDFDLGKRLGNLKHLTKEHLQSAVEPGLILSLEALNKILNNIQDISNRINKLVLYTRMETDIKNTFDIAQKVSRLAATQPLSLKLLRENMTFKSDIFRHAVRLTLAMIIAYVISVFLSLAHSYWVLLTLVTILKPAYALSRKRNISRVSGTLVGVILVSLILYFISNTTVLLVILMLSMLVGYSLLRVDYFGFVVFLTVFVITSLYFLNPDEFKTLIGERLIDTVIGSLIAFLASRFIFPVWGHEGIKDSMQKMLEANRQFFLQAWMALKGNNLETPAFALSRRDAIVSLTNLSDNFQRMLSEPQQTSQATLIHQFVIANHMLTGHIAALANERFSGGEGDAVELEELAKSISFQLQCAEDNLRHTHSQTDLQDPSIPVSKQTLTQMSMIFALSTDIRKVSARLFT